MIYLTEDLSVCIDSLTLEEARELILEAPEHIILRGSYVYYSWNRDIERRIGMGESSGKYAILNYYQAQQVWTVWDYTWGVAKVTRPEPTGEVHGYEIDRRLIRMLLQSEPGDLVAIIGLGDDKYQHINGVNIPQDDDVLEKRLKRKKIKQSRYIKHIKRFKLKGLND